MSKEAARKFYEKLVSDEKLQSKINGRSEGLTDDDMVKIAADAGFSCTVDELDEVGSVVTSELSDAALAKVTGGAAAQPTFVAAKVYKSSLPIYLKPGIQGVLNSDTIVDNVGTIKGSQL